MNSADLARLELAKRAFKATQPGDAEVQTGVRRARLAIGGGAKLRRRWLSKGLVFVVLAIGSLAYAKPQALGDLVEKVLPREAADVHKRLLRGPAREPVEASLRLGGVTPANKPARDVTATAGTAPVAVESPNRASAGAAVEAAVPTLKEATVATATVRETAVISAGQASTPSATPAQSSKFAASTTATPTPTAARSSKVVASASEGGVVGASEGAASEPTAAVSDWGRVGQALARGDDVQALAALDGLSGSDDQRTRDKADIGRAQLLMAHGNPDKACALARSLTHRRAGSRIERQAQLLLKSCGR